MRIWLLLSALVWVCSCTERTAVSSAANSICRVQFGAYCISAKLNAYKLDLKEIGSPLHGFATVVSGERSGDSSTQFVALVTDLDTPAIPSSALREGCELLGTKLDNCDLSALPTVVYQYDERYEGNSKLTKARGVKVTLLHSQGSIKDSFVIDVAYPCQSQSGGAVMCAAALPVCKMGPAWSGCKV